MCSCLFLIHIPPMTWGRWSDSQINAAPSTMVERWLSHRMTGWADSSSFAPSWPSTRISMLAAVSFINLSRAALCVFGSFVSCSACESTGSAASQSAATSSAEGIINLLVGSCRTEFTSPGRT